MRRRNAKASREPVEVTSCVAEIMGTELFTLTPDTGVAAALRLAATKRITHFLVIDDGNLTGIVCQSDLAQARKDNMVADCMSTPVLCISPETTIEEAAGIMQENAVGCLPVVTGTFLVGMVTREVVGTPPVEVTELDVIEEEKPEPEPTECAACGSKRKVRRDLRCSLIPLCETCARVVPADEPMKGN